MLSEIISFVIFAVSLIGLVGFFIAIMTSPPAYMPEQSEPEEAKSSSNDSQTQAVFSYDRHPIDIHQSHPKPEQRDGRV